MSRAEEEGKAVSKFRGAVSMKTLEEDVNKSNTASDCEILKRVKKVSYSKGINEINNLMRSLYGAGNWEGKMELTEMIRT